MNAQTTKTTPAKKASKPRVAAPALDLAKLTVEEAAAPTRASSGRQDNPFRPHMEASAANRTEGVRGAWKGAGKAVVVPTANVTQVTNLIRYAANDMNIGSSIVTEELTGAQKGNTRVTFCAKSRKAARNGGSE